MGFVKELTICNKCKQLIYFGQCGCTSNEFYNPLQYWTARGLNYLRNYYDDSGESDKLVGLENINGRSLIEIGCAYGEALYFIQKNYPDMKLTGVDISPTMILKAKGLLKDSGIDLMLVDGKTMPFEDNQFDIVYSHGMFVHVPPTEIHNYVSEAMRIAKVGRFMESSYKENKMEYYFAHDYGKIFDDLGYGHYIHSIQDPATNCNVYIVNK